LNNILPNLSMATKRDRPGSSVRNGNHYKTNMDILKCYKILELDYEASIDEAREAYIDMVRVWHPDRFTENPRLREKAEEKLKKINMAYAGIKARLSTERGTFRTNEVTRRAQGALEEIRRDIFVAKEIARNLCSRAFLTLMGTDFKQIFKHVLYPKIELGEISDRKNQNDDGISRRDRRMGKSQNRHRNFADIYEEVARAKKEEKRKMRETK